MRGASRSGGRKLIWGLVVVAATLALYIGVSRPRPGAYAARLPPLPDLAGQTAAVRGHLTEADRRARSQPTSAQVVGALGVAYHADLFYDHAERAYALAEELDGAEWRWSYYRALVRGMRGDTDGLSNGLRQVVAAAPDFGPAWWRLGEADFKARRYERAGEAWRRVRQLAEAPGTEDAPHVPIGPVSAYAALGLARLAMVQGEEEAAVAQLEALTDEVPGFGPAFRLLSDAYASQNRVEEAQRAVRHADRLPTYEPYLDPLTEVLIRESRSTTFLLQQAATADLTTNATWREFLIRRALEFDPDHPDALFDLATMFRVLRRYDEALELLERHRRQNRGDFRVLADIGRCLSGLGRFAEAEPILRRALEGLDTAATRYALGSVLDRVGRATEAVAEYRRALEHNPNHRDALSNLGASLANRGQLEEATIQFERLIVVDPNNANAYANLGEVLTVAGARDRAVRAFRDALRIDSGHEGARVALREIELR